MSLGEQPPSSMAPVILKSRSGDRTLVIGGSGGSMITTAMALVSAINWIHLLGVVAAVSNYGWKLLFHFILSSLSLSLSQSIMNHVWLGMGLKEAIAAPIVFVNGKNKVYKESRFDKVIIPSPTITM